MQTPAPRGANVPSPTEGEKLFGEGVDPRGPGRVLVIANDRAVQSVVATLATIEGCEAMASPHGLEAQLAIRTWQPRVILLDLDDVADDPSNALRVYRDAGKDGCPIIILASAELDDELIDELDAAAVLTKPFAAAELLELLRRLAHCSG